MVAQRPRPVRALAVVAVAIGMALLALAAPSRPSPAVAAAGSWSGTYYNNKTLTGTAVLTRNDGANLDFLWTGSPGPGVSADNWSASWQRTDTYAAGTYHFSANVDDGVRIYVDGTKTRHDHAGERTLGELDGCLLQQQGADGITRPHAQRRSEHQLQLGGFAGSGGRRRPVQRALDEDR
jgi:hypothetical protein